MLENRHLLGPLAALAPHIEEYNAADRRQQQQHIYHLGDIGEIPRCLKVDFEMIRFTFDSCDTVHILHAQIVLAEAHLVEGNGSV